MKPVLSILPGDSVEAEGNIVVTLSPEAASVMKMGDNFLDLRNHFENASYKERPTVINDLLAATCSLFGREYKKPLPRIIVPYSLGETFKKVQDIIDQIVSVIKSIFHQECVIHTPA